MEVKNTAYIRRLYSNKFWLTAELWKRVALDLATDPVNVLL